MFICWIFFLLIGLFQGALADEQVGPKLSAGELIKSSNFKTPCGCPDYDDRKEAFEPLQPSKEIESFSLGKKYLLSKNYLKAMEKFNRSLRSQHLRTDSNLYLASLIGLGLAFEGLQDLFFAEGYFKLAAGVISMQWLVQPDSLNCNFLNTCVLGFTRQEALEGLARTAYYRGDATSCFYWSEIIRILAMAERMYCQRNFIPRDVPKELYEKETSQRRSLALIYKKMGKALDENDRKHFLELNSELSEIMQDFREIMALLQNDFPQYAHQRYLKPKSAEEISLRPGESLVEYQVLTSRTLAWLIQDKMIVKFLAIPIGRQELSDRIKNFLSHKSNKPQLSQSNPFRSQYGKDLYGLLIGGLPLSPEKLTRLIIVPDEILCNLPFQELRVELSKRINDKIKRNLSLGDLCAVEYYPSATSLALTRIEEGS